MTEAVRRLHRPGWAALACGVVAVVVYLNALGNGFAYDDVQIIQENEAVHSLENLPDELLEPYWPGTYAQNVGVWRPVVTTLFTVEWALFGDDPAPYHAVSLLLHAGATLLVVLVLTRLLAPPAPLLGGLLFAVHPVHVEAVSNIIGNADVLAALFVLAGCLVHLDGGHRYGWRRTAAVGALFLGGVLTKEGAVVLPGLLFLLDAARREVTLRSLAEYLRRRGLLYGVLVGLLAALFAARTAILGGVAPAQSPSGAILLDEVPLIWTLGEIWTHYVRLLFFPADLAADYGGVVPVSLGWNARNVAGVLAVLAFLGLAWGSWRRGPTLAADRLTPRTLGFAVVWFGITVLPVSNIVFISPVLVAERTLYLPSVAFAAGAGWFLAELVRRRRTTALVGVTVVTLLMGARTWTRTPVWNDTWTLFSDLLERHPEAGRAWFHYADRLYRLGRFEESRRAFSVTALLLDSDYAAVCEIAGRLMTMPDVDGDRAAEFLLRRAWRERPEYYTAPGYLAALYLNQGRYREAEAPARAASSLAPANADMHRMLGAALSGQGRPAEAIPHRLAAMERGGGETWRPWLWLARDYAAVGDTAATRAALDSARERAPDDRVTAHLDSLRNELVPDASPTAQTKGSR